MSGAGQPDAERRGVGEAVWGQVPQVLSHFFLIS